MTPRLAQPVGPCTAAKPPPPTRCRREPAATPTRRRVAIRVCIRKTSHELYPSAIMKPWKALTMSASLTDGSSAAPGRFASVPPSRYGGPAYHASGGETLKASVTNRPTRDDFGATIDRRQRRSTSLMKRRRGLGWPSLRRAGRSFSQSQGAVGRCVDALVPVIPPDPVAGMGVIAHDLLDHATTGRALGRLRFGDNVISRRESHVPPFLKLAPQGISQPTKHKALYSNHGWQNAAHMVPPHVLDRPPDEKREASGAGGLPNHAASGVTVAVGRVRAQPLQARVGIAHMPEVGTYAYRGTPPLTRSLAPAERSVGATRRRDRRGRGGAPGPLDVRRTARRPRSPPQASARAPAPPPYGARRKGAGGRSPRPP